MAIWIDAEAFVEALNWSSIWGWSTEQDQTAHKWVFSEIEKFLNDNQQPDGDLINRVDAMGAVQDHFNADGFKGYDDGQKMMDRIKALPSAEQVTGKLNNPDDSLLTDDSKACKEQKSKLDLISRQDAWGAIEHWGRSRGNLTNNQIAELQREIESLPSEENESRLYIKIYADDEPQDKAEKMYQICVDIAELAEVAKFLKEYCDIPSAPDIRQRGEWVRLEREENVYDLHGVPTWGVNYMCDKCGFITTAIQDHFGQYKWCPSCGADMRGEEE